MKFCSKCGKEVLDEAVVCPNCGCSVANPGIHQHLYDDEVNGGLCVLSALIPLFGIIYWPLKYKETPVKAQACGITAIVSWVIGFVLWLIIFAIAGV